MILEDSVSHDCNFLHVDSLLFILPPIRRGHSGPMDREKCEMGSDY